MRILFTCPGTLIALAGDNMLSNTVLTPHSLRNGLYAHNFDWNKRDELFHSDFSEVKCT